MMPINSLKELDESNWFMPVADYVDYAHRKEGAAVFISKKDKETTTTLLHSNGVYFTGQLCAFKAGELSDVVDNMQAEILEAHLDKKGLLLGRIAAFKDQVVDSTLFPDQAKSELRNILAEKLYGLEIEKPVVAKKKSALRKNFDGSVLQFDLKQEKYTGLAISKLFFDRFTNSQEVKDVIKEKYQHIVSSVQQEAIFTQDIATSSKKGPKSVYIGLKIAPEEIDRLEWDLELKPEQIKSIVDQVTRTLEPELDTRFQEFLKTDFV